MPTIRSKVEDPCGNCRDRHLKCDDNRPRCGHCIRLNEQCVRDSNKLKFRFGSSARYDATFKKDQTWLERSKNSKIQFVDQTPELENYYATEDPGINDTAIEDDNEIEQQKASVRPPRQIELDDIPHHLPRPISSRIAQSASPISTRHDEAMLQPAHKRRRTNDSGDGAYALTSPLLPTSSYRSPQSSATVQSVSMDVGILAPPESPQTSTPKRMNQAVEAEYRRLADTSAAAIPSASSGLLLPEVWKKKFFWPNDFTTLQCACLMRYYIEELGPWFDVCDPARHFTNVVPQRARRCPPLLNAIFTAAARHLTRISKFRTAEGFIKYCGVTLRNLTQETAIHYHNACIAYLIELSTDPEYVQDENLLAAVVILRYYEELDASLTGEDNETFLHTFQLFTNAQASTAFSPLALSSHSSYSGLWQGGLHPSSGLPYSKSFRHASFRIALRQEITSAFMKQRPIHLPLEAWSSLRSFDEAEDDVWTDRLIVFCADVLQFCFGDSKALGSSQVERWSELKEFEKLWSVHKPPSFGFIHYATEEVFPQIWYMAECHVVGMQYLDLARILLTVYDPTIPRLGPGAAAAMRRVSQEVQQIVLRLCGIALSNKTSQPGLVMASMAIAVCGEYFSDRNQQRGMLDLLVELDEKYAWPSMKTVDTLRQAWSREP